MNPARQFRRVSSRLGVIVLAVAACAVLAGCGESATPPPTARVFRVGYLGGGVPQNNPGADAWRDEMRRLGYIEGENLVIEWRWAEGHNERLPALAAELAQIPVDVLFSPAEAPTAAAQAATRGSAIPVVFYVCGDPVRGQFVESLAHPGGNLTGVTASCVGGQLQAKRLELLRQLAPAAATIAVLWHAATAERDVEVAEVLTVIGALGLRAESLEVVKPADLDAFAAGGWSGADGMVVLHDPFMLAERERVAALAMATRTPMVFEFREYVEAGGLASYGANHQAMFRKAARVTDRVLKGARPTDIPVEQPATFETVLNRATAEALGLTLPTAVIVQATEVIQ
jgi:putative ABC transport system substrate-binding protein